MRSEIHPGRFWFILGFAFVCGAASFLFAAVLTLYAFAGHGSQAGNILRGGLAISAFFMGCFFVTVGALYHASRNGARR
jgi:hypothetical protein